MKNMPITEEQMVANRKYVDEQINKCATIANHNNLHYVLIVHWDYLANKLVSTVAYFEEYFEADTWAKSKDKLYSDIRDKMIYSGLGDRIIYSIYIDGQFKY